MVHCENAEHDGGESQVTRKRRSTKRPTTLPGRLEGLVRVSPKGSDDPEPQLVHADADRKVMMSPTATRGVAESRRRSPRPGCRPDGRGSEADFHPGEHALVARRGVTVGRSPFIAGSLGAVTGVLLDCEER